MRDGNCLLLADTAPLAASFLFDIFVAGNIREVSRTDLADKRPATHDLTRLTPPSGIFITDYGQTTGAGACVWSKKKFPCPMWRYLRQAGLAYS